MKKHGSDNSKVEVSTDLNRAGNRNVRKSIPTTSTPVYHKSITNPASNSNVVRNTRKDSKTKKKNHSGLLFAIVILESILLCFVYWIVLPRGYTDIYVEAGSNVGVNDFMFVPSDMAYFASDVSILNTSIPGDYHVTIGYGRLIKFDSILHVEDTISPVGQPVNHEIKLHDNPLAATDFVTDISDVTNVNIEFLDEPDFTYVGTQDVNVIITDTTGNSSEITSQLTIITDTECPVIYNVCDLEAYIGDPISYMNGVYAEDNWDEDIEVNVDNSCVNLTEEGEYQVIYTAVDEYGNVTTETCILTLKIKPEGFEQMDEMETLAQDVLSTIITDDMTDMEKAFKIFGWVRSNIYYASDSDKTSYIREAIRGFTTHMGDCFTYFAVSKALLDEAGIENIDMIKSDTTYSSHYWNLINVGFGWYHFDTTAFEDTDNHRFMLTDAELDASTHWNSHVFDESLYPERETESCQYMLNYYNFTIVDGATPPNGGN